MTSTVGIIGAGSSGLACAKALKARGVDVEVYEIGSDIGGMWRYENENGLSSAYRSLHIDTSRRNLGYSDFPIPAHLPQFMSHADVLRYLESFAGHFGLRPLIRFKTRVTDLRPEDGTWRMTLDGGEIRRHRAVIVANGHLWDPRLPAFAGTFTGTTIHSHHYRTSEPYRGRRVLIVGIGNSAVDIAADLCKVADRTFMSTRRSAWIMPKYIMGIPTDRWSGFINRHFHLPTPVTRTLIRYLALLAVGDQARYGVPRPAHPIWREHATLSQELLPFVGHGWIDMKPDVAALEGHRVRFTDGSEEEVDAIIYATGYRTRFPFLEPALFRADGAKVELYRRMRPPSLPGLYFAGLVQPVGPTIPLVEIQARWLACVLAGDVELPSPDRMHVEIARHHDAVRRRYLGSERYALEVDFRHYARQLRDDMRRGRAGI